MTKIHERIKSLRTENGFESKKVAEYLNIELEHYYDIEEGHAQLGLNNMKKLCYLYNCPSEYLSGEDITYDRLDLREDEKIDLNAIAKMNQVKGDLKLLRKLEKL